MCSCSCRCSAAATWAEAEGRLQRLTQPGSLERVPGQGTELALHEACGPALRVRISRISSPTSAVAKHDGRLRCGLGVPGRARSARRPDRLPSAMMRKRRPLPRLADRRHHAELRPITSSSSSSDDAFPFARCGSSQTTVWLRLSGYTSSAGPVGCAVRIPTASCAAAPSASVGSSTAMWSTGPVG